RPACVARPRVRGPRLRRPRGPERGDLTPHRIGRTVIVRVGVDVEAAPGSFQGAGTCGPYQAAVGRRERAEAVIHRIDRRPGVHLSGPGARLVGDTRGRPHWDGVRVIGRQDWGGGIVYGLD